VTFLPCAWSSEVIRAKSNYRFILLIYIYKKSLASPTARFALSACRSSEDSLERMWSQQFSERLKAARLEAAPERLTSLEISLSSSAPHRAAGGPEALLLLCMLLRKRPLLCIGGGVILLFHLLPGGAQVWMHKPPLSCS